MQVGIFKSVDDIAQEAALYVTELIEHNPEANICMATRSCPPEFFQCLNRAHQNSSFTLEEARVFSIDDYAGLAPDHPQLHRNVLTNYLVGDNKTGLDESRLYAPKGDSHDLFQAAEDYEKTIKSVGGIDLQVLGLGSNGHIAFNEPGGSLMSRCHIDYLTSQTKSDVAHYFKDTHTDVPKKCITQGLATIMDARRIVVMAFDQHKAEAVQHLVEGSVSAMWPGTALQMHKKTTILIDEAAASRLVYGYHYREMWERRNSESIF